MNAVSAEPSEAPHRWCKPGMPHKGWIASECVIDHGGPTFTCEACGNERVRYEHKLMHPAFGSAPIGTGCECAKKLTGDYVGPDVREREARNAAARIKRAKQREAERRQQCIDQWFDYDDWSIGIRGPGRASDVFRKLGGTWLRVNPLPDGNGFRAAAGPMYSPHRYSTLREAQQALLNFAIWKGLL